MSIFVKINRRINEFKDWTDQSNEAYLAWEGAAKEYFDNNYNAGGELVFDFVGPTYSQPNKWRGCCNDDKGYIYFSPYDISGLLKYKVDDQSSTFIVTNSISAISSKWVGMEHFSGQIFCNSYAAGNTLVVDTSDDSITGIAAGIQARCSSVDSNGTICRPQWAYSPNALDPDLYIPYVGLYNVETQIATNISYTPNRSGPAYQIANWEQINSTYFGVFERYWGSVPAPNGKVYGIPYTCDRILILDTNSLTVTQGGDLLNAGGAPEDSTAYAANATAYWNKWSGGSYSPFTRSVYAMPRRAKGFLKINIETNQAVETSSMGADSDENSKSFGSVVGPDGRIYSVPWGLAKMYIINPRDDSVEIVDLSSVLNVLTVGAGGNFFSGGCFGPDGAMYFSPFSSNKIMRLRVGNPTPPPKDLYLHRCMNSPL